MRRKHTIFYLVMAALVAIPAGICGITGILKPDCQDIMETVTEPESFFVKEIEIQNTEPATKQQNSQETTTEPAYWFSSQAEECILSTEEAEQLQSEILVTAEFVSRIYKEAGSTDAPAYSSGVENFTDEQRRAAVEELGKYGAVSVADGCDMQNYEKIEAFYAEYLNGGASMVTIYEVYYDGIIGAVTFICREGKLQTYYVGIRWREGAVPEIQGISIRDVAEIKLTEKGYFIYAYETVSSHASLRPYWRIKPLPDKCKELTEKYISKLSYVNYNMLVTDWDSESVEKILMPCMFEDIYHIDTGENFRTKDLKIPAEQYEQIMMTYFPVSVEQLREHCGYDSVNDSYPYEMIYARPYPPFGEVVGYTEHEDGTITLIVDGVWPDYNSDCAFTNRIVVQPFEDGTFRYLSNCIEERELEIP